MNSSAITCPSCGHQHSPDPEISAMTSMCCEECDFEFDVVVEYEPVYTTQCATHTYGDWQRHYDGEQQIVYRACTICGNTVLQGELP